MSRVEEMKAMKCNMDVGFPLLENIVKDLKKLMGGELRNKNQCMHLVNKVDECIKKVNILVVGCAQRKLDAILMEVLHTLMKVQALVENCAKEDDWSQVAMTLIGNMESYRELLLDLECVFHVVCSIFHKCNLHKNADDWMYSMDFYPLVGVKLEEDRDSLSQWLKDLSESPTLTKDATSFASYLCKWIECLQKVDGRDLDSMMYPNYPWSCCLMSLLYMEPCKDHPKMHFQRVGESGEVFKTKYLDMDCVVKIIEGFEEQFCVEVGVLGGLNHPNITKLIGCGRLNDPNVIRHGSLKGDENEKKHFFVMEVLEKSLSQLLRTQGNKRSYLLAIHMMLQIARGLSYLHDMKIAHCDLKLENILVQTLEHPCLDEELVVLKLVDFGLSKINASNSRPSQFHGQIGTACYMAPEPIASKQGELTNMNSFSLAKGQEELQACIALGLVGMSGVGKTTLAKAILKSIQHEFEGHCFLENLKAQYDNLEVMKNVLHNLGKGHENIKNIQEAKQVLVSVFKGKMLLIVLDDISYEQVVALNGLQNLDYWKGSKLIITTRSLDILERFEVHVQSMYMSIFSESDAKKLFAKYAYEGGKRPLPYFKDIERKVIKACHGLPLNLMVMDAYLGKEKRLQIWERALSRLLRVEIEEEKLLTSLKVSFDNLDNYEKKVFLDISQFFVKNLYPQVLTRSMAMEKWGFGDITLNQSHAIDVLVNRCLLKVDDNECLCMHDQLYYMGQKIVEEDAKHSYV